MGTFGQGSLTYAGASMNEEMKKAWLLVAETIDDPTYKDFNVFMLTWALAINAERKECAKRSEKEALHEKDQ
jgi:hypothetical protein